MSRRGDADQRRQLRGQARSPSLLPAKDHGGHHPMTLLAKLRKKLDQRVDLSEVLAQPWTTLSANDMAARPVYLERDGRGQLGDLFSIEGPPTGRIEFTGDLGLADRLGAGLQEGEVLVKGNVGRET